MVDEVLGVSSIFRQSPESRVGSSSQGYDLLEATVIFGEECVNQEVDGAGANVGSCA